jgi:hypothetical protein
MAWYDNSTPLVEDIAQDLPPAPEPSVSNLKTLGKEYAFNVSKDMEGNYVPTPWGVNLDPRSFQFMDHWLTNTDTGRVEADRKTRYSSYMLMDAICGEAILTLDAFTDEALGIGFVENPIEIKCNNPDAQKFLDTVLNNNKIYQKARGLIRNILKYGDLGLILDFPQTSPKPEDIRLLQAAAPKWSVKVPKTSNLPYAYKIDDTSVLSKTLSKSKSTNPNSKLLAPWEFVHLSITDVDMEPYGRSILEPLRTAFDQLVTIESLLAMSRASKVERLVIKVPTGGSGNPSAVMNQLQNLRAQWKNVLFKDTNLGNRSYAKNPSLQDILIFPSDANFGIDKMSSSVDIASTEDAEYFRQKAIMMTKLPRGYFIADQVSPRGQALQAQDIKFGRALIPLQDAVVQGLVRLATTILAYSPYRLDSLEVKARIKRPPQLSEAMLDSYRKITDTASAMLVMYYRSDEIGQAPIPQEAKKALQVAASPREAFVNLCRLLGMPEEYLRAMTSSQSTDPNQAVGQYITSSSLDFKSTDTMIYEKLSELSLSQAKDLMLNESNYSSI